MNEKVDQTKTHTFGISYFISDPLECKELRDSVVGVTKDGSGHAQHFRNVFKQTSIYMKVIQVKDCLYQFLPKGREVRVNRYETIDSPKLMKRATLPPLSGILAINFSLACIDDKTIILID